MSEQLTHSITMLNQIASNFAWTDEADAVRRVVDHITRFWSPAMRGRIKDYARNDGSALSPVARQAALTVESGVR